MESIVRELVAALVQAVVLTPGKSEEKRLIQQAKSGAVHRGDDGVVLVYALGYGLLLLGSIWGSMLFFGASAPTLTGYALCYLCGMIVPEGLLLLYSRMVGRSEWQVLAAYSIHRDAGGRVKRYISTRWCWFFRCWGMLVAMLAVLAE